MSEDRFKALEGRIAKLEQEIQARESDLQALTNALIEAISMVLANDPRRKQVAERLRTFGDRPGIASKAARRLFDSLADRIETAG